VIIALAGFLAFVALAMAGLYFYIRNGAPAAMRNAVQHQFPKPALQTDPQDDLKRFRFEQEKQLTEYQWVDRSQGLIRIPIEEATRIIASRGDDAYDALDPPSTSTNSADPNGARP
jgi:hypothetical protein